MAGFLCGKTIVTKSVPIDRLKTDTYTTNITKDKDLVNVEAISTLVRQYIQQNPSEVCALLNNCGGAANPTGTVNVQCQDTNSSGTYDLAVATLTTNMPVQAISGWTGSGTTFTKNYTLNNSNLGVSFTTSAGGSGSVIFAVNCIGDSSGTTIYYNTEQSQSFTRNNCPSGQTGSTVTYTVGRGQVSSNVSQADADSIAMDRVNAEGQDYANSNGTCTSTLPPITANISYEYSDTTGNGICDTAIATVTASEPVTTSNTGWVSSNGTSTSNVWTKTYNSNSAGSMYVSANGRGTSISVSVTDIGSSCNNSNSGLTGTITLATCEDTNNNGSYNQVTATLTTNQQVGTPTGWTGSGTTFTRTYISNGVKTVTFSNSTGSGTATVNVTCIGQSSGQGLDAGNIGGTNTNPTINPTGGTAPYTYLWSTQDNCITITNETTDNPTITCNGSVACTDPSISVEVTDANNNISVASKTLTGITCTVATTPPTNNINFGTLTGNTATPTGSGNHPNGVTYNWSATDSCATFSDTTVANPTITFTQEQYTRSTCEVILEICESGNSSNCITLTNTYVIDCTTNDFVDVGVDESSNTNSFTYNSSNLRIGYDCGIPINPMYSWSLTSPSGDSATLSNSTTISPTINNMTAGATYSLTLTVRDSGGAFIGRDTMNVVNTQTASCISTQTFPFAGTCDSSYSKHNGISIQIDNPTNRHIEASITEDILFTAGTVLGIENNSSQIQSCVHSIPASAIPLNSNGTTILNVSIAGDINDSGSVRIQINELGGGSISNLCSGNIYEYTLNLNQ